ncbi:MAG: TRAP transporter substrate-binding protein DctP [Burkholderiaceae bacterium]|nr:TRAP transporter substrate-binding protein DctP [Burkholderiales bacterium]MCZ8338156.1 TRAP transporter substrate-binding protein DctP [Burkholderiaceae bacterium]
MTHHRRSFLKHAGAGAATGGAILGAPAIVHAQPTIRWRMPTSFAKSLNTLFGVTENVVKRVAVLTDGKFQISAHAPGEIVPALQVLDAVQNGTVEIGHTALYYYFGKDPTWAFGTTVPFGLNQRQTNSWWFYGGGDKLFNEFAAKSGIVAMISGNTGTQMGGFFRKEINSVEDLKGLKFRIAGLAGGMFSRLGVVPQQIAAGEIYSSLEKGTIDAAEWVGPYDDEKLGLGKVAKFYYTPGFWEGSAALHTIVNQKAWDALPPAYKAALQVASSEANTDLMAEYDSVNPPALRRLLASGVQLRAFPKPVMDACYASMQDIYKELAEKNAEFKKLHDHYFTFARDQVAWHRVAEARFDDFISSVRR